MIQSLNNVFWSGIGVELAALAVLFVVALLLPARLSTLLGEWESRLLAPFLRLARHPAWSMLACGLAPLVVRAVLWPLSSMMRHPVAGTLDEYSYLLAADTFAHGRLTNPAHPMWQFFETLQVIQTPSYASKYPPLQGLLLAAGQVLLGHPWWAVYFSVGIMSATFYWALRGWVPGRWALLGAFLAMVQWEVFGYWMNSYWGGALAATGGALLLGGFPRLAASLRRRSPWIPLLMALGLAMLANTRPYEGLVFAAPLLIAAAWRVSRRRPYSSALLPAALLLLATAGAMMYYCWRVTGNPLLMPYVVHERQYAISPNFIFLPARAAPVSRHPMLARYWQSEREAYDMARSARFPRYLLGHIYLIFSFYIGPALLIAFAALGRKGIIGWLVGLLFLQLLAVVVVAGIMPHYFAPSAALVLLLAVLGLRRLHAMPRWGRALVHVVVLACVIRACLCLPDYFLIPASHPDGSESYWRCCVDNNANFDRVDIEKHLAALPARQLVIVQYSRDQRRFKEYVYNSADIDGQRVVWARSMGPEKNLRLLDYYRDRDAWLLTMFGDHGEIVPYSAFRAWEQ